MRTEGRIMKVSVALLALCAVVAAPVSVDAAVDSIRIVDAVEFSSFGEPPGAGALQTGDVNAGPVVRVTQPVDGRGGVQIGIEISLDDSEQVELRDTARLYVFAAFGRMDGFSSASLDARLGQLSGPIAARYGLDSPGLLVRAVSRSMDASPAAILGYQIGTDYAARYAGFSVGYSTTAPVVSDPRQRGFDVALSSMVMLGGLDEEGLNLLEAPILGGHDKAYNIGLNIGYRGFTFAASFLHGAGRASAAYESYDVGLIYEWSSWATSIAVGGYFSEPGALLAAIDVDRMYSVEIGASYAIRPGLRILGRLQFFDYRSFLDAEVGGLGGTLYLGTSLGF